LVQPSGGCAEGVNVDDVRPDVREAVRLAALRRYGILDSAPEDVFDDIAVIAAHVCGTPMALVSLVDEDRQWFKAKVGIDVDQTSRDLSFCAHAIQQDGVFEIRDATQDSRFVDHPFVTDDTHVRFYAGAPLVTSTGQSLGALCVVDTRPRDLEPAQREVLTALSRIVMNQIEARQLSQSLLGVTTALERLGELSGAVDLEQATAQVLALAHDVLPADGVTLLLADEDDPRVLRTQGLLGGGSEQEAILAGLAVDIARPTGSVAASVRLGEPLYVPDLSRSTVDDDELGLLIGARSALVVPFHGVTGALLLLWGGHQDRVPEAARSLLALLAAQAGPHLARVVRLRDLAAEASTDALTGLPNRRPLRAALQTAAPGAAVVMMDLDHFKAHNDSHGHESGDQVLRDFAAVLLTTLRGSDLVGRWGGEEFVVVVPEGPEAAARALERVRAARRGEIVTFSAGIAAVEEGESGVDALVRADRALYLAKDGGRDRVEVS
jgi:diguanylate cyclase (GGDEF)-like protein